MSGLTDGPFARAFQKLRWLPDRKDPAGDLAEIMAEVKAALRDDATLNTLIRPAMAVGAAAEPYRRWLRALLRGGSIAVFPRLDPETLVPRWPEDDQATIVGASELAWRFHDSPHGTPIDPASMTYSLDRARARGSFSLGSKADRPWLAAAIESRDRVLDRGDGTPELNCLVRLLASEAIRFARARPDDRPGPDWPPLAEALDAIIRARETAPPDLLDLALAGPVEIARAARLPIHPAGWSFRATPDLRKLPDSEVRIDPGASEPAFSDRDGEAGALVLLRFGLGSDPALVSVSSGPAPDGYRPILDHLAQIGSPEADRLVASLRFWPSVARSGRLDLKAIDLYLEFWETLGVSYRRDRYEDFTRLEAKLATLLERSFGLIKFEPRSIGDLPESWVEVVERGPLGTGRVRRVRRPGLKTTQTSELRVPSQVEVE